VPDTNLSFNPDVMNARHLVVVCGATVGHPNETLFSFLICIWLQYGEAVSPADLVADLPLFFDGGGR